jgi:hypothetical protein
MNILSMYLKTTLGLKWKLDISWDAQLSINRLARDGAKLVAMVMPPIWRYSFLLNFKMVPSNKD